MSEMLMTILIMAIAFILAGISMGIIPFIVRKNTPFGVLLPEHAQNHTDIQKYKKQFAIYTIGFSLIGAALMFIGLSSHLTEEQAFNFIVWGGSAILVLYTGLSYVIYYYFHRKVKVLKQQHFNGSKEEIDARIMVSTDFRDSDKPVTVSNLWLIAIGFIIILITAVLPVIFYDQIPDQVAINFGLDGTPNAFRPKSPMLFAVMPITQLMMLLIFVVNNYGFKRAKQQIKPKNPKISVEQNRAYRYAWSKYMVGIGLGITLLLLAIQLFMMELLENVGSFLVITSVLVVGIIAGQFYIIFKYGQGGERYQPNLIEKRESSHQMVDDDEYWKLGMIYYNPNDPSVFVERRFGVGITFNFARWQTWALGVGLFVITILMMRLPIVLM